ncbi:MAG: MBL fold metallo-hydrolase [Planctomycetes bacterium]|nr:MBL fold metallo-hydrolase [Planctomycetota bacterium]
MPVEIKWLLHASFRLAGDGAVIYLDPWKIRGEPHDADIVFVSHSHYDHFSPGDIKKISGPATTVVGSAETAAKDPAVKSVSPGEVMAIGKITMEFVPAYNIGKPYHPRASNMCGVIVNIGGKRIYYSGDCDLIPEMGKLDDIDAALLPVAGTYTMSASEAAQACTAIGCAKAVPCHWGDVLGTMKDAQDFVSSLKGCQGCLLMPGKTVSV